MALQSPSGNTFLLLALGWATGVGLIGMWWRRRKKCVAGAKPRPKIPFGRTVLDEFSTASGGKAKFDDVGGCYFYVHFDNPALHALVVDGATPYVLKMERFQLLQRVYELRGALPPTDPKVYDADAAVVDAVLKVLAIEIKEGQSG